MNSQCSHLRLVGVYTRSRVLSHNGGAGGAWVADAVALADEGERVAGELRHMAGMYVCAIALGWQEGRLARETAAEE